MSAVIATGNIRKWLRTVDKSGYRFGPDKKVSLSEVPVLVLHEASNSALNLVVVDDCLTTPCTGR